MLCVEGATSLTAERKTIFALASAQGRSGVAVIRVSGPGSRGVLTALTAQTELQARVAALRDFRSKSGELLDRGVAIWFPAPRSFTGEDVVELHVHGGRAVIAAICEELSSFPGVRAAGPGEFTRRAFECGKLDLTAVEGLADVIAADTQAQRRQALHQLGGGLYRLYESWRQKLTSALAMVEADIEFPEEGLPDGIPQSTLAEIVSLVAIMRRHLGDHGRGERLRHGLSVVIAGPPNVGKSSLLNLLAKRDAAIVSPEPGTTRDVIEVNLELGGYPVTVSDTAGIREATEAVEIEGVRRSRERAHDADIKIVMVDALSDASSLTEATSLVDGNTVFVTNKIDLRDVAGHLACGAAHSLAISVRDGTGVDQLLSILRSMAEERLTSGSQAVITRVRHRQAIEDAVECLEKSLESNKSQELVAEDIRLAVRSLGRVMGRVDVEQVLDVVFREFCIGK
jgi:tRNA modification GTPase